MKNFILLIAIALASTHTVYSCVCEYPKPDEEICASDGKTYRSDCFFDCSIFDTCYESCPSDDPADMFQCILKCDTDTKLKLRKVSDGKCSGQ